MIHLSVEFAESEEEMDRFARLLRVLYDNGYQEEVRRLVETLVAVAKDKGIAVPPDIERFGEHGKFARSH